MAEATKRYAVVTGANRGIGFEVCRQLASNGIVVVLTARNEEKGIQAAEKLKEQGLADYVVFHQLDVADPDSIASLADFIRTKFGKLDTLVNNAGVNGADVNGDALRAPGIGKEGAQINYKDIMSESYELAEECININYYGAKRTAEALVPMLQLSDSPKIVNVSSSIGQLMNISNQWAKGVLTDADNLTEDKVDEVVHRYLEDFQEGSLQINGWPTFMSGYTISKAALNAYTRILARKHPDMCINSVCPGFVNTDMNFHTGILPVEEGAASPVRLALLPHEGGPSGRYFQLMVESHF